MAKYVSPFVSLSSGKSNSSEGYTSPFHSLTSTSVAQHRKDLEQAAQDAKIAADAQAAIDAKNAKGGHSLAGILKDIGGFGYHVARPFVRPIVDVATLQGGKAAHDTAQLSADVLGGGVNTFAKGVAYTPKAIYRELQGKSIEDIQKKVFGEKDYNKGGGAMLKNLAGALTETGLAAATIVGGKVVSGALRGANEAKGTLAATRAAEIASTARKGDIGKAALGGTNKITDPARLLGDSSSNAAQRIADLEKEKQAILKNPNTYTRSATTVENAGTKPQLMADTKFAKNRADGAIRVASGTTREVGNVTETAQNNAQRLRDINKEQKAILEKAQNPYKDTTATSKLASDTTVQTPKETPKVPHNDPGVDFMAKDKAETLRSRLTNQLISSTGLLERFGTQGKALASKVNNYNQTARDLSTKWFNSMPTYSKLSKGEAANFARAAQGYEQPKNFKVAQAVAEWQKVAPEIRQQFIQHSGEEIGNIQNFFPHTIKPEFLKRGTKGFNAAVQHLVDTGQAKSSGDAVNILNFARRANTKGNVLGSFRFSRDFSLPEHMYDTSKTAIANYLEGAAHSVAGAQHLGMDRNGIFHAANDLIGQVAERGGNADKVKKVFEQSMGLAQHSEAATKASNITRSIQIFTKLGLGAITNAGQTINTVVKNGFIDTAKGLAYLSTKDGRQFARETGAFTHGLISDLREMRGIQGAAGKVGAPFFNNVEQFNRYLASTAGKFHAERLARRGNKRAIEVLKKSYNVEGNIGKNLTREQQLRAGRASSDVTQFVVAPHTLPGWASSPIGKLVAQFQTFSYKQSGFVWNEILKPLKQGNALPLARLLACLPAGYGIYTVKAKLHGKDTSGDTAASKVINAWKASGGGGTAENLVTGTIDAKKYSGSGKEFAANEIANVGGVTAGTLVDTLNSVYGAASGNLKAAKQQGLSLVPIAGGYLKNKYAPSGSQSGRDVKADPEVNKELNRLGYKLQDTSNKTGRASKLSSTDYKKFVDGSSRLFTQRATQALNDPYYQALSDDDKKAQMSNILSQSRSDVLDLLVGKVQRSSTPKYKSYR